MAISLKCECGRDLRLKDELAGKKIRCPECKVVLSVPAGEVEEPEADDESLHAAVATPETKVPPTKKKAPWDNDAKSEDEDSDSYASTPKSDEDDEDDRPRKKKRRSSSNNSLSGSPSGSSRSSGGGGYGGVVVSGGIISGVLMMIGAVVWFVAGLAADRIYFYPPVLFVFGIVAVFKGVTGRE